jgi:hypothetical protein
MAGEYPFGYRQGSPGCGRANARHRRCVGSLADVGLPGSRQNAWAANFRSNIAAAALARRAIFHHQRAKQREQSRAPMSAKKHRWDFARQCGCSALVAETSFCQDIRIPCNRVAACESPFRRARLLSPWANGEADEQGGNCDFTTCQHGLAVRPSQTRGNTERPLG